ncbi:MAG TPA: hypothetical protein VD907_04450 [Verrucomicrobiae bacterium]|nr:hypothetical protein [Verrucomicrobiae bacterium]
MQPVVFFAPGFQRGFEKGGYNRVRKAIKRKGYEFVEVPIEWRTYPEDWKRQFLEAYRARVKSGQKVIFAGFSLGAVTAFLAAADQQPDELWLFSFSARFAEDIPHVPAEQLEYLETKTPGLVAKLRELVFAQLAPRIQCYTLLMMGAVEIKGSPLLHERMLAAQRSLANTSSLVVVEGVGHKANDPKYANAIAASILRAS